MARVLAPAKNSFFHHIISFALHIVGTSFSNCSPLSSGTQCANCSEPKFDSRERQEKSFFAIFSRSCHGIHSMHPCCATGVPVAWSHLGMRTGNSANEGDLLGSCWVWGRIHYEIFFFFYFFLLCFLPLFLAPVSKR